jgi:1,4-dihydroxy-2-naphthoate octaprenyltransferase
MNIKAWIQAFRLRTLPLALSSILMGIIVSYIHLGFNMQVSIWAIITTLLLQILSNLANDYGDAIKGTDNENRVGPERTVQSGKISPKSMKTAIIVFSFLSLVSGLYLIWLSGIDLMKALMFLLLGVLAIAAAIKYTIGKKAYGYSGLGDLFVFLFFGLLAVLGSFYLNALYLSWDVILPAITIGLLSTAVLNLNNMRDLENDKNSGKNTLVVRMGIKKAKLYHTIIINIAFFSLMTFMSINDLSWQVHLALLVYPLFIRDLIKIDKETNLQKLDPYLKKTALKTLLLVLVFGGLVVYF